MKINNSKLKFSERDFITLFLSRLFDNEITKIDVVKLRYELAKYYSIQEFAGLFEDISLKKQIEGNLIEIDNALLFAYQIGMLSNPIQGSNVRKIMRKDIKKMYPEEYVSLMDKLLISLIKTFETDKIEQRMKEYDVRKEGILKSEHMDYFIERFNNGEFKKDTCLQLSREFTCSEEEVKEELESYQRLLESGIINEATKEERESVKKLIPNNKK